MDKKTSRSVQPSPKGVVTDSKKSQDVASGKLWPRGGRRREPTGGSNAAKNESSRKPQRTTRACDNKRPRQRGAFYPDTYMGRAEAARLENEQEAEMGSVFVPGSKKQSLNHLLNFVYTPHATEEGQDRYHHERGTKNNANRLMLTRKHKYNKEHFLQANCQFIVNSSGNYNQYMNNPDALVDWNLIEQVNVQVSEFPSCPICLYPPIAAKMTRCGHIYCWSCVLHYLSLSDKSWRKCPICYESIHKQDLKSVVSIPHNTFNVNDVITFKLMKRPRGSLIAYPATATVCDDNVIFNLSQKEANDVHSKLLIANNNEILTIIEREFGELQQQIVDNGMCPENCFSEQALVLLDERKSKVLNDLPILCESFDGNLKNQDDSFHDGNNINPESVDLPTDGNQVAGKYHYFYQASDGQHIYLHAINARMLEHTYGSLEFSPKTLTGKIYEKEGGSMTEELRKRLRYLQHLPVTCQFEVAEIQLKAPIVSKETLEHFKEQIEIRKKRRQRRAREEKNREKRIADEEDRLMGKFQTPILHIESEAQFPCFDGRARTESECTPPSDLGSEGPTPSSSLNAENDYAGPSFAKMLASSTGKAANKWPALKTSASIPVAEVKLINVTGQKMNTSFQKVRNRSESEIENDDYELLPVASRSIGDVIVHALQNAEINEPESDAPLSGKRKKKKNRQKVLFSTTMAYTEK